MAADAGEASVLRAKYLDWCSAQIADRFLRLPPDEIYELAHEVTRDPAGRIDREALTVLALLGFAPEVPGEEASDAGDSSASGVEGGRGAVSAAIDVDAGVGPAPGRAEERSGGSYHELVARVAERLMVRMDLPAFSEWSAAYREAPERYDREMMGLWRG